MYRVIDYWLNEEPPEIKDLKEYQHIIFDGTFLHRPISIVTFMDNRDRTVIGGKYGVREYSGSDLISFFRPLIAKGLNPLSCTLDGNPEAIRIIRTLWPDIIIQRCIIHIHRQGLMWCRREPGTPFARRLRAIFLTISDIDGGEKRDSFLVSVKEWEEEYGNDVTSRAERGRVFSDIKRARSMLLKALPDMFHYLDDPAISRSTNGLESYFSRLKSHYRQHRGLSNTKLNSYFKWYIFYKPK